MSTKRIFSSVTTLARVRSGVLSFVLVVGVLAAVSLLVVTYTRPAHATFPGVPGKIAYESNSDGPYSQIYTIWPGGGGKHQVTHSSVGAADPAYSPDGARIAYYRDDGEEDEIYTIKV